jgi:hypothetical protein
MVEVQSHGFTFEKWVRDQFFGGYEGKYHQGWDIPAEYNTQQIIPAEFRHLPVSVKTAKLGSPIGLGDARRQRSIDSSFVMIVGFWKQRSPGEKWFEEIGATVFSQQSWSQLWGNLKLEDIQELDDMIKDLSIPHQQVREKAKKWKRDHFIRSDSEIVINPKIDSKNQRRVQCSLPFLSWSQLFTDSEPPMAQLFGQKFENSLISYPRRFSKN